MAKLCKVLALVFNINDRPKGHLGKCMLCKVVFNVNDRPKEHLGSHVMYFIAWFKFMSIVCARALVMLNLGPALKKKHS